MSRMQSTYKYVNMLNIFKPEVVPNFELIELENVCRICLHSATNMLPLFNNEIDSLISEFLPQKLQRKPSQPHQICAKCFEKARSAYIFKKQCQYADELIKSMLNEPNISKTYNEKYTQTDVSNFIYPCEKCEKKFEFAEILKQHRLNEHRNTPNICRMCGKVFSSIVTLRDHLISVHPELGFLTNHKCDLCEKIFTRKWHLKRHLLNVHNVNEYFETKDEINWATEEDSTFVEIDEKGFSCENCLEDLEAEVDLKNHECPTTFLYKKVADENSSNWLQLINDCDKNKIEIVSVCEENNECNAEFLDNLTDDEYEENTDEKNEDNIFAPEIEMNAETLHSEEFEVSREIFEVAITEPEEEITRKIDTNGKRFECTICSKSFTRKDHLQRHVKNIHIDFSPFQCTKQKRVLKYHMSRKITSSKEKKKRKEKEKLFSCKICIKKFISEKSVQNHIAVIHNGTKEFSCKYCLKKIIGEIEYERHCKEHCTGIAPAKRHLCPECGTSFAKSTNLMIHLRRHRGEKPFNCTYCGRAFTSRTEQYAHERVHTGEKKFKCTVCSKSFPRNRSLKVHIRTHTGERPFKCSHCPMTFKDNVALKQHNRKHTGERSYCDLCNLSYSSSTILLNHKRRVHGIDKNKEYSCKICSKKIIGAMEYKKHCKVHHTAKTKSHICSECGAGFIESHQLKVHIRKHTGEKPFICEYCDKAFASPSNLYRHTKIHTGEKSYHCTDCPKSFLESAALKTHMRTHTGERPYKCSYCPMAFTENRALKKHLGKHTDVVLS